MMNNLHRTQATRVVGAIVLVVLLAGCVNGPGSGGTSSSGYKGSAPWNISHAEQASQPAT